jgi:MOSC domain-containing protein
MSRSVGVLFPQILRCRSAFVEAPQLPDDLDVLRPLTQHNRLQIGESGRLPCAGLYAVVAAPGTIGAGNEVVVAQ